MVKLGLKSFLFLFLIISFKIEAAVVTASSNNPLVRPASASDDATWRFFNPNNNDVITWVSGINTTDGVTHSQQSYDPNNPEKKADTTTTPPSGRTFNGFNDSDGPGPNGSITNTTGSGHSRLQSGAIWGKNFVAEWTVTAFGTLGSGSTPLEWSSLAKGQDPYYLFQDKLDDAGILDGYDMFFIIGLLDGNFSPLGGIGLNAAYEDATNTNEIINISIDYSAPIDSKIIVTGDNNAKFFLLSSMEEAPVETPPINQVSLTDIKTLLEGMINLSSSGYEISSPLYIGVILENIEVPTITLDNGALAKVSVNSWAKDKDSGPDLVDLIEFSTNSQRDGIYIEWTTGTEVDNAGFRIWRGTKNENNELVDLTVFGEGLFPISIGNTSEVQACDIDIECIKGKLGSIDILAQGKEIQPKGSEREGAYYSYLDTGANHEGWTYYYLLEDLSTDGKRTFHWDFLKTN